MGLSGGARSGFSTVEGIVSLAIGSILIAGLGSALLISNRSLTTDPSGPQKMVLVGDPLARLRDDLKEAKRIEEMKRGFRLFLPDRDGDLVDDAIEYTIESTAERKRLLSRNGQMLLDDVEQLSLMSGMKSRTADSSGQAEATSSGGIQGTKIEIGGQNVVGIWSTTVPSIHLPAGLQPGDYVLAGGVFPSPDTRPSSIKGWSELAYISTNPQSAFLWGGFYASGDPTRLDLTLNQNSHCLLWTMRLTGIDRRTPIEQIRPGSGSYSRNSSLPTILSLSTTKPDSLVLHIISARKTNGWPGNSLVNYRSGIPSFVDSIFARYQGAELVVCGRNLGTTVGTISQNTQMLLNTRLSSGWIQFGVVLCPAP